MTDIQTENAVVEQARIYIEDHGILTSHLTMTGEAWGQGFGGYDLRYKDYCQRWIQRILETFEVSDWAKLKGQNARIRRENGLIVAVGHIVKDKWFCPRDEFTKKEQEVQP